MYQKKVKIKSLKSQIQFHSYMQSSVCAWASPINPLNLRALICPKKNQARGALRSHAPAILLALPFLEMAVLIFGIKFSALRIPNHLITSQLNSEFNIVFSKLSEGINLGFHGILA